MPVLLFTGVMALRQQRWGTAHLEDGGRVAYALTGTGPLLLVAPGWLSHLELGWSIPAERMFHEALSSGRTLVRYDRPGCGLSDPYEGPRTMALELDTIRSVTRVSLLTLRQLERQIAASVQPPAVQAAASCVRECTSSLV